MGYAGDRYSFDVELSHLLQAGYPCAHDRRRLHSTLGYSSPADYENSTLGQSGASLTASRLAPLAIIIKEKAAWSSPDVSTEAGRVQTVPEVGEASAGLDE